MNRKQRRDIMKDPKRKKQHADARMIIDSFMAEIESVEDITESEYHSKYEETQTKWLKFATENDFNKKYFYDIFKLDFQKLRSMEQFEKMTVPEIVDLCISNFKKMRDRKKKPFRKQVGPTKSHPAEVTE